MQLNSIADNFIIENIVMHRFNCENNITNYDSSLNKKINLKFSCKDTYEIDRRGTTTIEAFITVTNNEQEKTKIEACIKGTFRYKSEDINKDEFIKILKYNGGACLYSILRGKIEAITSNIYNNGKITIPFINITDVVFD